MKVSPFISVVRSPIEYSSTRIFSISASAATRSNRPAGVTYMKLAAMWRSRSFQFRSWMSRQNACSNPVPPVASAIVLTGRLEYTVQAPDASNATSKRTIAPERNMWPILPQRGKMPGTASGANSLTLRSSREIMKQAVVQRGTFHAYLLEEPMNDFNRKVGETTARVNRTVSEAAERLEKDGAELIDYLNREVVPAVREQSTKALRVAAEKLRRLADYMDEAKNKNSEADKP